MFNIMMFRGFLEERYRNKISGRQNFKQKHYEADFNEQKLFIDYSKNKNRIRNSIEFNDI